MQVWLEVACDAGYMWLARSLDLPLLTFDRKQITAAPACGVKLYDITKL